MAHGPEASAVKPHPAATERPPAAWRHSLVRRLTWGVALLSLLSVLVQAVVLTFWLASLGDQFFSTLGDQARLTRAALAAAPAAERPALARSLSVGRSNVTAQQPSLGSNGHATPAFTPPEFEQHAARLRADGIEVTMHERAFAQGGTGEHTAALLFRLPVDGEVWWLERYVRPPTGAVTRTLVVWLLMLGGLTAVAVWWSVRAIARPLADLATQLGAQDGRLQPLAETAHASRELHTVTLAFNHLVHQVASQNQLRQQLLAGVSHDLRTPLARLRLRVETQCAEPLATSLTGDLLALEHIVEQFLAYVQGDTKAPPGPSRPIVDSVREVVASYRAAGHPVQEQLEPLQWPAPPLAVRRLLSNLLDNALAYGRPPVTVVLKRLPRGLELQVWDEGLGMRDDEFVQAQQPFVRLGPARPDVGHCGLGLAIVAQMARQLGGTLHTTHDAARGFGIVLRLPEAEPAS